MSDVIHITLTEWMALNGCPRLSLENRTLGSEEGLEEYMKRRQLQQQYCRLVEIGKILPLTTLENNICRCSNTSEDTMEAKKKLLKKIKKLTKGKLKLRPDLDALYNAYGDKLEALTINITKRSIECHGEVMFNEGDSCVISNCDDDYIYIYCYQTGKLLKFTYEEIKVSICNNSLEKARELIMSA